VAEFKKFAIKIQSDFFPDSKWDLFLFYRISSSNLARKSLKDVINRDFFYSLSVAGKNKFPLE
jgi:hypothetical protein